MKKICMTVCVFACVAVGCGGANVESGAGLSDAHAETADGDPSNNKDGYACAVACQVAKLKQSDPSQCSLHPAATMIANMSASKNFDQCIDDCNARWNCDIWNDPVAQELLSKVRACAELDPDDLPMPFLRTLR
jgi:hypothetical protein